MSIAKSINKLSSYELRRYKYAITKVRYINNSIVLRNDECFDIDTSVTLEDRIYYLKILNLKIRKITISISIRELEN